MADETQVLLDLENQRCNAIAACNVDALNPLLADDYVHVHMTGLVDDREGHFRVIQNNPRRPVLGETQVRVFGDLAVLTGHLDNHRGDTVQKTYCHRIAAKRGGRWQFVSIQLTPRTGD